jgi:hypothetical protein
MFEFLLGQGAKHRRQVFARWIPKHQLQGGTGGLAFAMDVVD